MYTIITIAVFLASFVFLEIIMRKCVVNADITRKIIHIFSGIFIFFTPYFLTKTELISIAAGFTLLLIFTKSSNIIKSIHSVERKTFGEVYFPLGIMLSAILFLPSDISAFQFGVLILALSDAFAALIGMKWGRHSISIMKGRKSLEGSTAFFLTSAIIWLFFQHNPDYGFLLVPLLLTGVEFFLSFGLDNLVLPVMAAYLFIIFK